MKAVASTPKEFTVYGRDHSYELKYGQGTFVNQSVPGEAQWIDPVSKTRRGATLEDLEKCLHVADALPHIDIVGSMVQPAEIPVEIRDLTLYAEMLKRTRKPVRAWVYSRTSAKYIVELFQVVAGGLDALRAHPQAEFGFEPISPLILPGDPLDTAIEFARAGVPITVGPMPQAMATAPVTLAGAMAKGHAEVLATLVILQAVSPGVPFIYFNCPHIMDPRTASLVFGSPEQAIFGVMATQMAKHYGFPVGVNVGLTDAKLPDAQSGFEKGMTLLLGVLAGADVFGGMGIAGCDQGFSLPQLVIDDEIIGFIKRVFSGADVDASTTLVDLVDRVGIGGSFLTEDHTLMNWRSQFWIPTLCDRSSWDSWMGVGGKSAFERAVEKQEAILATHEFDWLDEAAQKELDAIVAAAHREVLGE
jgi:trimethylamine--corrinoid protein Co-methyltransferase